jgi:hypothetical protein
VERRPRSALPAGGAKQLSVVDVARLLGAFRGR